MYAHAQLTSSRSLGSISERESTTLGSVMIEGGSGSTLLRLLKEEEGGNSKTMSVCPQALLLVILHRCQDNNYYGQRT
jgi:hypothetical protein